MLRQWWSAWRRTRSAGTSKTSSPRNGSADPAALRLDPRRRAALRGKKRIELTAREFRLLQALAQKEGETCTKHELVQVVWGSSIPGGPELVDEYVSRLRGKLGDDVIEAVDNEGYRYAATR